MNTQEHAEGQGDAVDARLDRIIDPLRPGLDLLPVPEGDGRSFLLHDPEGYTQSMFEIDAVGKALLALFDGTRSARQVQTDLEQMRRVRLPAEEILRIAETLETHLFLYSDRFLGVREALETEYTALQQRAAAFAGQSYPADPTELRAFFASLFAAHPVAVARPAPAGVIAPHIDLQIGADVYVPAYEYLRSADFDTVVILGTSHYSSEDLFILTEKNFVTPLGEMPTDREFVRALRTRTGGVFTTRDSAHRHEHSIEFQVLFLQYLFGNERVRIVPLLCTQFEHYLAEGILPMRDPRYAGFIDGFRETLQSLGRKPVFVMSVDWSHVGRKFHDAETAAELLPRVRLSDQEHFAALEEADLARFHALLRPSMNATNIDGLSCITTFFDLVRPASGSLLAYDQWHEEERESGVTYAAMAFWKK
jgi:AmmeMemoRadiSam system protein B